MKFSTKIRYGMRAMIEIASDNDGVGVLQKDIAKNQLISNKYLDQIISSLKAAQLIVNLKGKKSGYILTRKPSEITMANIYGAFEGRITIVDCLNDSIKCDFENKCKTKIFWSNLNNTVSNYFNRVTLEDLVTGNVPEPMENKKEQLL